MQIHVRGLVIHPQRGESGVVDLVVRADQKHATAFGRLRQHLAHALFRAGDLCYPGNDDRALRVIRRHVLAQGVNHPLADGADAHAAEVWPLNLPDGDAYYHPLLVHESVKHHQHSWLRKALHWLRGQKTAEDSQESLHKVDWPANGTKVVVLPDPDATT